MTAPTLKQKTWILAAISLIIFALAFVILYGRHAKISGSWDYLITQRDDYQYWAITKGASEHPSSDGNPFYYEEHGTTNRIPYPTALVLGKLARLLDVGPLFFFPIWYILAPFVSWLAIFFCLTHYWKYPKIESGIFSLLFLLSLNFIDSTVFMMFYRYSRPTDALWMLFIWASFVMNVRQEKKEIIALHGLIAAVMVWFNLLFAGFGMLLCLAELLWIRFKEKDFEKFKTLVPFFGIVIASAILFVIYVKTGSGESSWWFERFKIHGLGSLNKGFLPFILRNIHWSSIGLFSAIAISVALLNRFQLNTLTKLDRLLLVLFASRLVLRNVGRTIPGLGEIAQHTHYFMIVELFCLAGWLLEKTPLIFENKFKKMELGFVGLCIGTLVLILLNDDTTFFRFDLSPWSIKTGQVHGGGEYIYFRMLPLFFFVAWLFYRFQVLSSLLKLNVISISIALLLCGFGYGYAFPIQTEKYIENYPFTGAHDWLKQNAQKREAVLTAPHNRTYTDYLILYTDLKTYLNPYGDVMSGSKLKESNQYRFLFYLNLLAGRLTSMNHEGLQTTADKLKHLRLNYVLVENKTPFYGNVLAQLNDHAGIVYQDGTCTLLQIKGVKS
jgi:hypothetical protein